MSKTISLACGLVLLFSRPVAAQSTEELKRMTLQELLDIEVTTVSRLPEPTMAVPAAVYVITGEDIRRSGSTSIPEALRLAPGVQVARVSGGTWAIGIRGFADRLARSVLVLIDGRAVYSSLFAGTYWESQDTLLQDVDRIEVIRGPGGTLWGANAVNGIINIITKRASETQGLYVSTGAGTEDQFGSVRYGGTNGNLSYRGYAKTLNRGAEFHADGNNYDGWHDTQAGFRADWALSGRRTLTLQGDAYDGRLGELSTVTSFTPPFTTSTTLTAPISGANVLARLGGATAANTYQLQVYYDRTTRHELPVSEDRDTVDVDFQDSLRLWHRNAITWGGGYRVTTGRITAVAPTTFSPEDRTDNLYSTFVQDEIALTPNRWRLTIGSKFEHNAYSGFEVQPTARVLWTPNDKQALWAAVTRAVRTPSRVETDYSTASLISASTPSFVQLVPNPDFQSEKLTAYEAGYRIRPARQLYVTASAFYNVLRDTLSTELLTPFVATTPPPVRLILPVDFGNGLHGNGQGVELTGDARPKPWWRLNANYSYVFVAMSRNPGSRDVSQELHYEGAIPHHQLEAGTSFDVSKWSFDWAFRHVSELSASSIPAYTASDFRIAWHPGPRWEYSVIAQDLFDAHHLEWPSGAGSNIEIQRSVYARVMFRR